MPSSTPHLLIEDDPVIARALARALELSGRTSFWVASCADAHRLAGQYATAIVDLHLSDGNGLELFSILQERDVIAAAVFFSATTDPEEMRRAEELGIYIPKSSGVACAVEAAIRLEADGDAPESETRPSTPRLPASTPIDGALSKLRIKSE